MFLTAESSLQPPVVEADPPPARLFSPNQLSQFSMKSLLVKRNSTFLIRTHAKVCARAIGHGLSGRSAIARAVIRPTKQTS